jgi:hypothetical protein
VPSDSGTASFWIAEGTVATPSFSPGADTYEEPTWVAITTATSGAAIRYTLDGSEPTASSALYQWPILVSSSVTVKAKAFKPSMTASSTATAAYVLDASGAVATPLLAPAGGWWESKRVVTVTVATSGATIHYTTDGDDPTESDPTITSGNTLTVDRSMVIKVKAWKSGSDPSAIRRGDYVVTGAVAARHSKEQSATCARSAVDVDQQASVCDLLRLLTGFGQEARFIDELLVAYQGRVEGPRAFALANRVLLLYGPSRVPLDIALAAMPFEERCIDRASAFDIGNGQSLLTCSAEDLVVLKAFAGRERDWLDVDTIVLRQGQTLDVDAIWRELTPLLELKEDVETAARLRRVLTKVRELG